MEGSCEHFNSAQGCDCSSKPSSCAQSLTEMDFERGIWQAALDDNVKRVRSLLDRGGDPDARDGSGYTALVRDILSKVCYLITCPVHHPLNFTCKAVIFYCSSLDIVSRGPLLTMSLDSQRPGGLGPGLQCI